MPKTNGSLPAHVGLSKTGIYRYRRRVPMQLQGNIGMREIKRSLGKDYGQMLKALAKVEAEVDKLFKAPKSKGKSERDRFIDFLDKRNIDVGWLIDRQKGFFLLTESRITSRPNAP